MYFKHSNFAMYFFWYKPSLLVFKAVLKFFINELTELFSNKKPPLPFFKNSLGPLGQLLDIIEVLQKAASINTKPGSSHNELSTKYLLLYKYLKIFFLYFKRKTFFSSLFLWSWFKVNLFLYLQFSYYTINNYLGTCILFCKVAVLLTKKKKINCVLVWHFYFV